MARFLAFEHSLNALAVPAIVALFLLVVAWPAEDKPLVFSHAAQQTAAIFAYVGILVHGSVTP
jgi:hypothetical protein